jgi:hypothetical protein
MRHVSDKTVRNHVSTIFTRLQVADRSLAIVRAREAGLGGGGQQDLRRLPTAIRPSRTTGGDALAARPPPS